jgi:hypothetical protein
MRIFSAIRRIEMHASYLLFLMVGVGSISIVNASAQASTPLRAEQPEQDVQEQSSSEKNSSAGERSLHGTVKPTDPRARLEADRRDRGMPAAAFKRHLLQQRQEQMTREPDAVAAFATTSAPVWVPIGPTGADYEQNGPGTGYVRDSGRVRTILPHPTDANTVYLLTSGGGLWVTQNFTAALPAWRALTDSQVTTGGGSVAFGRTPSVIYLGLGDPFDIINVGGAMLKSSNGGATWTNYVDLGTALSVRDVKVDFSATQDIVLAATDTGLFRSIDGGISYASIPIFRGLSVWSLVQTTAGWLANAQPCTGVPANYCGTRATIYLSSDHGATWAPIPNTGNVYAGAGRTTLAVASPGDSIVYGFAENSASTDQLDLFRSTDGGLTWTALGLNAKSPTNPNTDNLDMDLMHDQSWYNQMVLIDKRDATRNTIYLGGNLSTAKSTDGGATWTLLSNWFFGQVQLPSGQPGLLPYIHADMHAAALSTAGTPTVMFGSDGGLFVSTDNASTWSSNKNNGLQTFLFYSLISNPGNPYTVIAGAQDNGTRVRKGNTNIYNQSAGGDGIGTGWSQANNNRSFSTTPDDGYFVNLTTLVPALGENFLYLTLPNAVFYTPLETPTATADPTGKVFFGETADAVWKTTDGYSWNTIGVVGSAGIPAGISLGDGAHAVGVSPIDLLHVGALGRADHLELTTNGGTSWTDTSLSSLVPGFSHASSITWANNKTIYVTSRAALTGAVRVVKSTDGGISWARADAGLPDVPTNRVIVDPRDATKNTLLAASDLGVFRSTDGGANWVSYGAGLPHVAIFDIYMPPDGGFVRIATYGRGIWELPSLEFAGATLTASSLSCDKDTALDNGGTANLVVTIKNGGAISLTNITAKVTSTNSAVSFPNGNTIIFPSAAPSKNTSGSIAVALNGAVGIQQIDFTTAFTDPALNISSPVKALASFRANFDEIPHGSSGETFEASVSPWTTSGTAEALPDISAWHIRQITPVEHRAVEVDSNAITDKSLISPVMSVGTGAFSISFEQRYFFDYYGGAPPAWYDGMVVEISGDGGVSWADIGAKATPGYDHVLHTGSGNPLAGRSAYTGISVNYPNFRSVTVNLGTAYAGKNVQIRFRVGTDDTVGDPGVEIRNITASGLTNKPFTAVIASKGVCTIVKDTLTSSLNPSKSGNAVTFTATISGGSTHATGTVTFKDGTATIGTGTLNSAAQAMLTTATLAVGSHSITASYGGDPTHAATISAPLAQVVN